MNTNELYEFLKTGKVSNNNITMKTRTVRDEMVKFLYNEKQIPSTSYVKHWNYLKVKEMYLNYVEKLETLKGTEND